jgi:cobalt-zinc-cadmium efflux system protein
MHDHHHHHHDHDHGHGHGHHHHHEVPSNITKSFAIAVLLNLIFVVVEVLYALHANSSSLLADAGHNLGDVLGLGFAWLASWLLTKPANTRYSYGYKRTSILSALLNALILVIGSLFIAFDAIHNLIHPVIVHENIVIIVAAIGIVVNGVSALLFTSGHEDLQIKAAFLHLAYDALISLGVVIAAVVIKYTHWYRLDPILGLLIVVFIIKSTWSMLRESVNMMLDAVPEKIDSAAVREYLLSLDGVNEIHDMHIWGLSTTQVALTAHLVMPEQGLTDADFAKINAHLKEHFKIDHATLQVEKGDGDEPCERTDCC